MPRMNSRALTRVAFLWFAIAVSLGLATPWLGLAPDWLTVPLNVAAPALTALLIARLFVEAVRVVARTGRTLTGLPLTLCQVLLFGLLFFQIAAHLGAGHFVLEGPPRWQDWAAFAGAHALRAADLLDVVEAYDLNIQSVRHASGLTAAALVAYHFATSLFLIGLLTEWITRFLRSLRPARQGGRAAP